MYSPFHQRPWLLRVIALWLSLSLLQSCAVFHEPPLLQSKEFGVELSERLDRFGRMSDISRQDIDEVIPNKRAFADTRVLAKSNIKSLNALLKAYARNKDLLTALESIASLNAAENTNNIALAFALFPIQREELIKEIDSSRVFLLSEVQQAALVANLDPVNFFPATASTYDDHRITPLIHSLSLSIYEYSDAASNTIRFKPKDASQWQDALALHYEPVSGALTGSIVNLEADTLYDIEVNINDGGEAFTHQYQVKTRKNKPPVNPNNTIYLRDIYQGGPLDLSQLDINGRADGWTKIVGDGVIIDGGASAQAALSLGDSEYVLLENITTKGGLNFGIHARNAHHLWIDGCDVSEFGRVASEYRDGVGYESAQSTKAINYDSGIFLRSSGVIVVENCEVHSPNHGANHWGNGHPKGASAMLLNANHPVEEYRGQYIIRNNRFYGTDERRFNDVIESRSNVRRHGGFLRDSAIHDNYLAFANDDIIELDGGQNNVLLYSNVMTQAYCGISLAPNMLGPSYIFNNDIVNLGDERGAEWAAFKMGGLFSAPAGKSFIFQNYIDMDSNGIGTGGIRGDATFWVESRNNIFRMTTFREQKRGYGIRDTEGYFKNKYLGDFVFNTKTGEAEVISASDELELYQASEQEKAKLLNQELRGLNVLAKHRINNFSDDASNPATNAPASDASMLDLTPISSFSNQDRQSERFNIGASTLTLSGNTWKSVMLEQIPSINSVLSFDLEISGNAEIVGVALENNNRLSRERVIKLFGSQSYGIPIKDGYGQTSRRVAIKLGDYVDEEIDRIVFILDNDGPQAGGASVQFANISLSEPALMQAKHSEQESQLIQIGAPNKSTTEQ